jgi:tetratricopeptide (TPR) repeat protein
MRTGSFRNIAKPTLVGVLIVMISGIATLSGNEPTRVVTPAEHTQTDHPEAIAKATETQEAPKPKISSNYEPDWARYRKTNPFEGTDLKPEEWMDTEAAESNYLKSLSQEIPDEERRQLMLDLAQMLERNNNKPKIVAVYEKYIEVYPNDTIVPELYMRLGFLYREMGSFDLALSKFYSVLNASLKVDNDHIRIYRLLSQKAQLEIADTYYQQGNYISASRYYDRLRKLDLSDSDRAQVEFKLGYARYLISDDPESISTLEAFTKDYPDHPLVPESYYLMARSYKRLGQPKLAIEQTLKLLKHEKERETQNESIWQYWKRRTGNQLANEFFEQLDYMNALKIYQTMAPASNEPEWTLPIYYQIGLCYEHLRLYQKALDSYQLIGKEAETADAATFPQTLKDIIELAGWRYEHMDWLIRNTVHVDRILQNNPLPEDNL